MYFPIANEHIDENNINKGYLILIYDSKMFLSDIFIYK
jgi:hypothetical protein